MITSSSNSKVKEVVRLKTKAKERNQLGVYLTEGFKMFKEAPLNQVREVYVSEEILDMLKENTYIWKKLNQLGYEIVSAEVFRKMSDTQTPQGILTILNQPKYDIRSLVEAENCLLMVLEDIQDPGNLGTIIRTGEGAGITGVIMCGNCVDIFHPKTIRSTMGSVYRVPFTYEEDIQKVIENMHLQQIETYAAHLSDSKYYDEVSYAGSTAFLIGNEGNGLKDSTIAFVKNCIKIPMEGQVESLNAGIAAAILMYEAHSQRKV